MKAKKLKLVSTLSELDTQGSVNTTSRTQDNSSNFYPKKNQKKPQKYYVDTVFDRSNSSIGNANLQNLVWVNIADINLQSNFENINSVRTASIRYSLYFLSVAKTELYKRIMTIKSDSASAYSFKFFRKGFKTDVKIDGFVPYLRESFCYTDPRQCKSGALIQKAVAKCFQGFQKISKYPSDLTEIITCYPKQEIQIIKKYDITQYLHLIKSNLQRGNMIFARTKNHIKIREKGLLQNEQYCIVGCNQNGLGFIKQLSHGVSQVIEHQYSVIPFDNLLKYCCSLSVLKRIPTHCFQNWIHVKYELNHPVFYELQVKNQTDFLFNIYFQHKYCRNTVILAEIQNDTYQYVSGSFKQFSCRNLIETVLKPGRYVIYLNFEEEKQQQLTFKTNIYYASSSTVLLKKTLIQEHPDFISVMFSHHAHFSNINGISIINQSPLQYISTKLMYQQTGYAYICVYNGKGSQDTLCLELNNRQFEKLGFFCKSSQEQNIFLEVRPSHNIILTFKTIIKNDCTSLRFPPPFLKLHSKLL